jgi:hypothetical protein
MAKHKIFYAWQSDTSTKLNRHFIHRAIENAIELLNEGIDIEDAPAFEIDHDTKDVPGHPSVADTICEKIDQCAIFLADVTFVTKYTKADGVAVKWAPNPNVMIELGYARRAKGAKRTIEVMNTGTPVSGKPTDLPFDLAHLRHPIQYKLTDAKDEAKLDEKCAELARDLANAFRTSLKTVIADEEKRNTATQAKAMIAAEERIKAVRGKFEQHVRDNTFYNLTAQGVQPILSLAIIPVTPANPPLNVIKRREEIFDRLVPLHGISARDVETSAGSARSFALNASSIGESLRNTLVEIREDGTILAAEALDFQESQDAKRPAQILFVQVEHEVFRAVERYLRLLRTDLNLVQDLAFCLTLHRARNFILVPDVRFLRMGLRRIDAGEISCPPTIIRAGQVPTCPREASELLVEAFNHLWQECGLPYDPHIQQPKF